MTLEHLHAATRFDALHRDPHLPLLLSNAWDAASARIAEAAGAPAVATTSAGIAWSLGYADGNHLPREVAIAAIARITDAVSIPVTVDLEGGYGIDSGDIGDTVAAAIDAGAVGINIEDGVLAPEEFSRRVAGARRAAERAGVPVFINARTDTYLLGLVPPESARAETVERAERYLDAGANGVFVPGVSDLSTVRLLAESIDAPLNVMAGAGSPPVAELQRAGVARISLGSGVAQAAYMVAQLAAAELFERGTYESLTHAADYAALNALFSHPRV